MCNMLMVMMLTLAQPTIEGESTTDSNRLIMMNFIQEIMSLECKPQEEERNDVIGTAT